MINEEIRKVCEPCGLAANYLTCLKNYGIRPHKPQYNIHTWYRDQCDVCHVNMVPCTEPQDFFNPDFTLIEKVTKFLYKPEKISVPPFIWKTPRKSKLKPKAKKRTSPSKSR